MDLLPSTNKRIKCSYTWIIKENPGLLLLNNEWKESPVFVTHVNGEVLKWKLQVKFNIVAKNETRLMFVLRSLSENSTEVAVSYTVQIASNEGQIATRKAEFDYDCRKSVFDTFLERDFGYLLGKKHRNSLDEYSLSIFCNIFFDIPTTSESFDPIPTCSNNHELHNHCPHNEVLSVGTLTDLTIISSEGHEIRAHKQLLMLHSDVFSGVYLNDAKLNKPPGVLEFKDASTELVVEIVRFLYTGKVNDLKKNAPTLLQLARKYGFSKLVELCKEKNEDRMSP